MATTTATQTRPAPRDERVYHPLDRVKGIIRRYVVIEGLLSVLLFFLAWFTIALVLDYGIFKAFTWDWVQDGAWWLRLGALIVAVLFLAGILIFRIVRRLTTEFTYPALALVLEQRFPKLLGDRLITAVELADVDDAAKYGYSKAMIRQTIDEARERVGQVDVNQAFNWRRLRLMGLLVVGAVVGLLFVGFLSHAVAAGGIQPVNAAWKSYHVASIVVERDVLLLDTPWPRRALLEMVEVPENWNRVPRDSGKATVRVKAYRWVIADRSRADGWRPLLWSDVTEDFVGMSVPSLNGSAGSPGATATIQLLKPDATADEVIENPAFLGTVGGVLGSEKAAELDAVIKRLKDMAARPSYGRRLRYLDSPGEVTYKYTGVQMSGDGPLKPESGSVYSGEITGLKDDVLFSVRAEDFKTPQRSIVLVPAPSLMSLTKVEYQPAYRHYASPLVADPANPSAPDVPGGYSLLAGLRQTMPEEALTTTGKQTIFSVPLGTELVISGITDKPIKIAEAIPKEGRIPGGKVTRENGRELFLSDPVPLPVTTIEEANGGQTVTRGKFTYAFLGADRITDKKGARFDLRLVNEDGLESIREFQINVLDDTAPVAEILPEVIRKVGKHHWVTARAKIPFNSESRVKDDIGLSKVAYVASFKPSDAETVQGVRAAMFSRNNAVAAVSREVPAVGLAFLDYVIQVRSDQANSRKESSFGMFAYESRDAALTRVKLSELNGLLAKPKQSPSGDDKKASTHVTEFNLETKARLGYRDENGTFHKYRWAIEGDFFNIGVIEIAPGKKLAAGSDDIQTRYDMQLFVEATDVNFDTGPSVRRSDPIELMVVSDTDLLVEIGKDEEKIGAKLDDALKRLASARAKYEFVRVKSETHLPDERDAVAVRSKDAAQDVVKAREMVDAVARDFRRIERECVFNQLPENTLELYGMFANRGERIMGETPNLVSQKEEDSVNTGRSEVMPFGVLTPFSTFPLTERSLAAAHAPFDTPNAWPEVSVVNAASNELQKLDEEVKKFRAAVGESGGGEKVKRLLRSILENQDRIARAIREAKFRDDGIRLEKTPLLDTIGQVLLAKGEAKKLKHGIQWRQFQGDNITIKVTSSDPAAVVVPAELKLDFENNSVDFQYEVRAGAKEGNYIVTLTPSAGAPITVQIQVK